MPDNKMCWTRQCKMRTIGLGWSNLCGFRKPSTGCLTCRELLTKYGLFDGCDIFCDIICEITQNLGQMYPCTVLGILSVFWITKNKYHYIVPTFFHWKWWISFPWVRSKRQCITNWLQIRKWHHKGQSCDHHCSLIGQEFA